MEVCCKCCVLSGRGLCDELITRTKESDRLWCVVVCDLETSWMRRPRPTGGCCSKRKKVDLLRRNPHWWSPIISSAYGVSLDSSMWDTILFVVMALLINRYNDRLLPPLRQFLFIPDRINKFMNLRMLCYCIHIFQVVNTNQLCPYRRRTKKKVGKPVKTPNIKLDQRNPTWTKSSRCVLILSIHFIIYISVNTTNLCFHYIAVLTEIYIINWIYAIQLFSSYES